MYAFALRYHVFWKIGLVVLGGAACSGADSKSASPQDTASDGDTAAAVSVQPVCEEPAALSCEDALISDLALHDDLVATGAAVTTTVDGDDFKTEIDATAGGFGQEANNPWVYVRFTESGAERVDIDDETALESMEWHLAARRFVLRLNGGVSGPSCVGAVAFPDTTYGELSEIPDGLRWVYDDYYTPGCDLINDSSGLEGSPQVALGPWWEYPGCIATTRTPFLVQLDDGHILKLKVDRYYDEGQSDCNNSSSPGSGSANLDLTWSFLR